MIQMLTRLGCAICIAATIMLAGCDTGAGKGSTPPDKTQKPPEVNPGGAAPPPPPAMPPGGAKK